MHTLSASTQPPRPQGHISKGSIMDFETIKRFITTGLSQKNGMVVGAAIAVAVIRVFSR